MKNLKKYPWLFFVIGSLVGLLIFYAYSYYKTPGPLVYQENQQPLAVFEISPYDHLQGNYDAPVQLVVFNDFACPYCQQYAQSLGQLLKTNEQDVLIVWKHFPLNQEDLSPAIASECADEQGQFWPYARKLSRHQGDYSQDILIGFGQELKLDMDQFQACLASDKYRAKVQQDYYEGIVNGVVGAPATFINGRYVPGAIPLARLKEIVKQR